MSQSPSESQAQSNLSDLSGNYGATRTCDPDLDLPAEAMPSGTNKSRAEKCIEHIITIISLAIGSYVGVTLRIYLSSYAVSSWDGINHFESIWAQILGSSIIGYLAVFQENMNKILYIALATGLCGSLTTFSTWNAEAIVVLLQLNEMSLNNINSVNYVTGSISFVTVLLLGVGMPLSSFIFGRNIAKLSNKPLKIMKFCFNCNKKVGYLILIIMYIACTVSIIIICMLTNNYYILFSLLFSSSGTYLRWCLSYFDNHFTNGFPLGTLMSNFFGSLILAFCLIARLYVSNEVFVINAVITGFCGSLTTVSTFICQLVKLSFPVSILYLIISLFTVQISYTTVLLTYSQIK